MTRLGVLPVSADTRGGVAQYNSAILEALRGDPVTLIDHARGVAPFPPRHTHALVHTARRLFGGNAVSWVGRHLRRTTIAGGPLRPRPEIGRWYRRHGIDLVLATAPNPLAVECDLPFVMPIHDLQHRLQPRFPEVSASGLADARERLYDGAARGATMLIADSAEGREDILSCYGHLITAERVAVLPFVAPPHISVADPEGQVRDTRTRLPLPERYFFYPAQFWSHKNHEGLVRALGLLRDRGRRDISLVFCGAHEGPLFEPVYRSAMRLASDLRVEGQVVTLPYVPDELIGGLYLGSAGLVMPTFFGPTNIPILEAWKLGRPVITSDIRGVRDQAGDAALLVDPLSPEAVADAMALLWDDAAVADRLVAAGHRREAQWTPAHFADRLHDILSTAASLAQADAGRRREPA